MVSGGCAGLKSRAPRDAAVSFRESANLAEASGRGTMAGHALAFEGRALADAGDGAQAIERYMRALPLLAEARIGGRQIKEWMEELKASMGADAYYDAIAEAERRMGYPLLTAAILSGQIGKGDLPGVEVDQLRAVLEEE